MSRRGLFLILPILPPLGAAPRKAWAQRPAASGVASNALGETRTATESIDIATTATVGSQRQRANCHYRISGAGDVENLARLSCKMLRGLARPKETHSFRAPGDENCFCAPHL